MSKPGKTKSKQTVEPEKTETSLRVVESKLPRRWLRRRYRLDLEFHADDFAHFQRSYDQMATTLQTWRQKRNKACAEVFFRGTIHPWISGRVQEYLRNLFNDPRQAFLQQLLVKVELRDEKGREVDHYSLEKTDQGASE